MAGPSREYDAVIIGAGLGGLLAGNYLVRCGASTLILEQHGSPGGYVSGFRRDGFYFDAGDQSFGSSGILFPVLRQLGLDRRVRFRRADYRWVTPWADFKVDSLAEVREAIVAAFPGSAGELDRYFRELDLLVRGVLMCSAHPNPLLFGGWDRLVSFLRLLAGNVRILWALRAYSRLSGQELAEKRFTNGVLAGFFGDFGYTGAPALATVGAWGNWLYDYWYPVGGLQALSDLLAESFVSRGGQVRLDTPVDRIVVQNGRAAGVVTAEGDPVNAGFVISAGDHRRLVQTLLPPDAVPASWLEEATQTPVSDTLFSVYLGADISLAELTGLMSAHHVFVQPEGVPLPAGGGDDPDLHSRRWVEISSPSTADPSLAPPGRSSLVLQCMSRYDWMSHWRTGPGRARTAGYRALKQAVAAQLIRTAERVIPGLSRRIVVQDAATPITKEEQTLNSEGATAGWTWDPQKNPVKSLVRVDTPVIGLFEAGHWTSRIGGVPAAALSAKIASDRVLSGLRRTRGRKG